MFPDEAYDTFQEVYWSEFWGYKFFEGQVYRVSSDPFASEPNIMTEYFSDKISYDEFDPEIQRYVDEIDSDKERIADLLVSEEGVRTVTSLLDEKDVFITMSELVLMTGLDPREPLEELEDMGMLQVETEGKTVYRIDPDSDAYWLHEISTACHEYTDGPNLLEELKEREQGRPVGEIDRWGFIGPDEN